MKKENSSKRTLICQKCRFIWHPRVEDPKACPRCHADWRVPYKIGAGLKKYWMNEAPVKEASK